MASLLTVPEGARTRHTRDPNFLREPAGRLLILQLAQFREIGQDLIGPMRHGATETDLAGAVVHDVTLSSICHAELLVVIGW